MFRNVLVPLDGSPAAEHALRWAAAAAGPSGAVHLVHVHVPPAPIMVEGVVVSDPTLDRTLREQEAEYMAGLTARLKSAAPHLTVTGRNLDTDEPPAEALTRLARDAGAELVAMTTHARGPFARFWLGSTSDEFLRHSPVPVLLSRVADDNAPADLSARPQLQRVIVPLDGSELAERIVGPAVQLGVTFGAPVTLVLVLEALDDPDAVARIKQPDLPESLNPTTPAQRAEMYLTRVAGTIDERGGVAHMRLVREGSPADVVLDLAAGDPGAAVALATHGRAGLTRLLVGSVADEVIRKAPGPVLAFHPPTGSTTVAPASTTRRRR